MSNQNSFIRFKEMLEAQQITHDASRDIRSYVLSLTKNRVGFGLVSETLKTKFGANIKSVFPNISPVDDENFNKSETFFATGTIFKDPEHTHKGGVQLFNSAPPGSEVIFFEPAFVATTHSWAHSFQQGNPGYACLGYVYDDLSYYFMADYPNRINRKLNSSENLSKQEIDRAEKLIDRIVTQRISKYNAQPMIAPTMTDGYARRVLVCDQAYADASTIYGKVGDAEFEKMLLAAISENPEAEILVKTHPDSVWEKEKRTGYYSHLESTGRIRVLRDPVNPYTLFEQVDTVYVGTSQMGLEALFAGKKVVTFGAPFYAGWGLTDDRQKIHHRHRTRTLAEIFHYFYIWYTIYNLPDHKGPAKIEDVLSYIEKNRPYPLPPLETELATPPKVSVILPVYGVEKYIEECVTSVQRQTLREIEIIPVNDATLDGSQAIIDRLAKEDARIKPIILSNNVGQGFARNRGLEAARGEYIWFIDSDDWLIDPEFLEKIVAAADLNSADMTRAKKAGEAIFDEDDNFIQIRDDVTEAYFNVDVPSTNYIENHDILHSRHFYLWLYRRSFVEDNEIRFVTTQWEERAFLLKAFLKSKKITLTTNKSVMYRIRRDSTARREKGMHDVDRFLSNFEQICKLLNDHGASSRQSPLRPHLDFQVSQFLHFLFFGFWNSTLVKNSSDRDIYYRRVSDALQLVDFEADDLKATPVVVQKNLFNEKIYHLIVSSLLVHRFEWIDSAIGREPVSQDKLYLELLKKPVSPADQAFQDMLSAYARNERVQAVAIPKNASTHPKPRIVIHIGATKTGSTFIQHMLEKNRPALMRRGIWFPEVGLFWQPTRPHKQAGHSEFTRAAINGDPALRNHIQRGLELMNGQIHTIVLSSEAFFLQENAVRLADYFSDYQIEMVVYLRRQDEWANSQYCEFVAGGAVGRVDKPIKDWLETSDTRRRLDYLKTVTSWSNSIGKDNVHVRVFDRSQFVDGDLLADFADAAGLPDLLDLPRPHAREQNEARLSSGHVELLRMFNTRPFSSRDAYFNFIEEVGTALSDWRQEHGHQQPKPWMLSDIQADALMTQHEAANAKIAAEYLGRDTPLFGPRSAQTDTAPVFAEEIQLVEKTYQRHAPLPQKEGPKVVAKPVAKRRLAKPSHPKRPVRPTSPTVVNYGLFGWRLWLLTPILAVFYARITTRERFGEFLDNPFVFSRRHWAKRHPLVAGLLYPGGNPMGPFGIFRLWIPIARKLVSRTGRADMRKSFEKDPILFARGMRSPWRRLFGRLMFPMGESCRGQ